MEKSSLLRASPQTPITNASDEHKQEHRINELISEYSSEAKSAAENPKASQNSSKPSTGRGVLGSTTATSSPIVAPRSLGSPRRVFKQVSSDKAAPNGTAATTFVKRPVSSASSDVSEG